MTGKFNGILNLFTMGALRDFFSQDCLNIAEYGAFVAVLIQNRIAFDTKYTPASNRDSAQLVVTAYINPKVTIDFSFSELDLTQNV